jgi:hypothetical protein
VLPFSYDAGAFSDGPCDPSDAATPTCPWSSEMTGTLCEPDQQVCSNRCVNTSSDAQNCGACGHACDLYATCQNGACVCPADSPWLCEGDFGSKCFGGLEAIDCSAVAACTEGDVTEYRALSSDRYNCGDCGHRCDFGATCSAGQCQCPAEYPWLCEGSYGSLCFSGSSQVDCSTVVSCSGSYAACTAGFHVDCASATCTR